MKEIVLLNIQPELALAVTKPSGFETRYDAVLGEHAKLVAAVVEQTEAHRKTTGAEPRWSGYLAIDAATRRVIGTCAYKGEPNEAGAVEIAYFTFPTFEGLGVATAMARRLEQIAADSGAVRTIVAHTLPAENASTRVLRKLGFDNMGEITHSEDGRVWRWERGLSA